MKEKHMHEMASTARAGDPLLPPAACTAQRRGKSRAAEMTDNRNLCQKLKAYPKSVFFMLGNEACERFSFYGMKSILTLYLTYEHGFRNSDAIFLYHTFTCIAYFMPLIGSFLADSYFGRFRVILVGSMIYVLGHALLSLGAIPKFAYALRSSLDFSGLLVIAIATGCIKPCVSAFAADQFSEDQKDLRAQFFSFFYFAINFGSLLSIFITPILRGRVQCYGSLHCFPLAFGVPGLMMLFAFLFFLAGIRMYKKPPPSKDSIPREVVCTIYTAAKRSLFGRKKKPVSHWLDRAAPEHSPMMIEEVKSFVQISILFFPICFFWSLFDQSGSTWVLQASRLDGRVGPFTLLPDQLSAINPLLVMFLIPLFEGVIYPVVRKVVKVTPLRKMALGGLLAALSFVMAGILQLEVNKSMEPQPGENKVFLQRLGNEDFLTGFQNQGGLVNKGNIPSERSELDAGMYNVSVSGHPFSINLTDFEPNKHNQNGYVIGVEKHPNGSTTLYQFNHRTEKTVNGAMRIHIVVPPGLNGSIFVCNNNGEMETYANAQANLVTGKFVDILPGLISDRNYKLFWGENCNGSSCPDSFSIEALPGAINVLEIQATGATTKDNLTQLVRPNTVCVAWMFIQYFIITVGEVLLSVTGLEFAYSQAGIDMKSVLTAMWLLTVFVGNVIDIGISGTHIIPDPALELFFYAGLMLVVMLIFIFLAYRYTYQEDRVDIEELTTSMRETGKDPSVLTSLGSPTQTQPISAMSAVESSPMSDRSDANNSQSHGLSTDISTLSNRSNRSKSEKSPI